MSAPWSRATCCSANWKACRTCRSGSSEAIRAAPEPLRRRERPRGRAAARSMPVGHGPRAAVPHIPESQTLPTHVERSGDLLTIRQDVPWLSRLLMLPLLLGSGYLFRTFFLSVGDVLGGVKESELLAGQIICLVLGLLVGVPGLMGFLIRNSLVIDKAQG